LTSLKGQPWGEQATMPEGTPVFVNDATASRAVQYSRFRKTDLEAVALIGGDLWRTLGGPPGGRERLEEGPVTKVTIDVGWIDLGEAGGHCFVAHCVARDRFWGRTAAVMNAEWIKDWDLAPRSHPGDGRFDIVEAELSWDDRWKVRRRLPTGSHLPHPGIQVRKAAEAEFEWDEPRRLFLDGAAFPPVSRFRTWLEPGSLTVYV
jgi:hypothetical protein